MFEKAFFGSAESAFSIVKHVEIASEHSQFLSNSRRTDTLELDEDVPDFQSLHRQRRMRDQLEAM